jgi:cell division protease FtsH
MKRPGLRRKLLYLVCTMLAAVLLLRLTGTLPGGTSGSSAITVPINEVAAGVRSGTIQTITVEENQLSYRGPEGQRYTARKEPNTTVSKVLMDYGVSSEQLSHVSIVIQQPSEMSNWAPALVSLLPLIAFGAFILFMLRRSQGGNNEVLSFGKSRARMATIDKPTVTFADVAGVDEATQELQEVVEFLKYPEKFASLGARIPRGVLLVGPPGTGKTLLARAVAGEAGVPFFSLSASEFVEMFVGVGASRVRDLFDRAKRNAPCIIFVDELDAIGRQRGSGLGGGHDEREQTLNQILVEMDGFDTSTNVIMIAATNRPDVLDPALLRPGRFDRQVMVDRPDIIGRRAILEVHSRGKPLGADVALEVLAKQTPGFSGADLANLVNEGAILAARRNKRTIGLPELEEAIDRVMIGPERKSRIMSDREKALTAYHESGHALVGRMLKYHDPVHKVSIVARGRVGGYTRFLPTEDRYFGTKSQLEDMIAAALGGHVAEVLVFGEMSTGPQNDIERATSLARQMVCEYGMSEKVGPRALGHKQEMVFLGRAIGEQKNYSEKVAQTIDEEVRRLVREGQQHAEAILRERLDTLHQMAQSLIQHETLETEALELLFQGLPSPAPAPALPPRVPLTPPNARPRFIPGAATSS